MASKSYFGICDHIDRLPYYLNWQLACEGNAVCVIPHHVKLRYATGLDAMQRWEHKKKPSCEAAHIGCDRIRNLH